MFPLETDFRAGLIFWDLCRKNALTAEQFTDLFFPQRQPENMEEAMEGVCRFLLRRDEPLPAGKKSAPAAYDFRQDWDCILSDFQKHYRIDLTDPGLTLHWWRFLALLEGLCTMDLSQRVYVRLDMPPNLEEKGRRQWLRLRRRIAIREEKETVAQHIAHLDDIIAQGKENIHG